MLPSRAASPVLLTLAAAVSLAALPAGCGGGGDVQFTGTTSGAGGSGGGATTSTTTASTTSATTSTSSTTSSTASTTSSTGSGGSGGNPISISTASDVEAETHVAAAPNGVVAVAWIAIKAGGFSTNGYRFSTDGGSTFGPVQTLDSPNGEVASDPVLAVDKQNNVYLTWIGFKFDAQGNPYDMHVYAATAPAGTTTFGAPVEVTPAGSNAQFDKPWIIVTNQNTVVVTYAKTSTGGIYSARSTDQGKSWQNTVIVEDGNFRNLVYPCISPSGNRLWAVYHAGGGVGIRWTDDDAMTWPTNNKAAVAAQGEQPAFEDPTCAANGNDVWVSYGLTNDQMTGESASPKLYTIRVAHSGDGGATIDSRVDAGDAAAGMYFMHPQLIRDGAGSLGLFYYAGNSDGDPMATVRRSRSADGMTWQASTVVYQPVSLIPDRASKQWLGDYIGFGAQGANLFMSYVDNSSGVSHINFDKAMVP
jgi:hypothetical protein